jgi:hypothetical protein
MIVFVMVRLIRTTPAQKVERDDAVSRSSQMWQQPIIQVHIVGKAVQQNDRRFVACIVSRIQVVSIAGNMMFKIGFVHHGSPFDYNKKIPNGIKFVKNWYTCIY